jgi:hypothetical protein
MKVNKLPVLNAALQFDSRRLHQVLYIKQVADYHALA